ncbi:2-oxoglutarate dehydrogenase, E2 component, dihydrolipoamide succinyltransferase [Actinoalloteichus hymeniacidonis]|uniref:Dihydrolipoamide acetyltransferase component of pyruvate dehydrogenase complex n=1 Tax=Actinoalloteichus hymeniacidonis TaxID=340345 RepID=A0AAC9N0R6_9PSEU|nr:2-oxoglutarate dehydrogenase, E2 component, dihydrolipoamide succinyltransferase [Actinoalloteichus hymeniacidonis]AOS65161.1 2-oxoglutarate dehydrogenase E2 component [Actinoalloteichus hymeniacidonis]MBB5906760.1 2-oxoglutarate dehydrogenase E2 component (dihydrolipoamide succinyltransferase) [Actinoalloteichus hymeniacidonis]
MAFSVQMPALGESVTEGTVTRWLKQEGDRVEVDEPLLEVSTDKVDTEIPSPAAGILQRIIAPEDETVDVGAELAVIDDGSGGAPAPAAEPEQAAPAAEPEPTPAAAAPAEPAAAPAQPAQGGGGSQGTPVPMPALGESVTEGTVTRWLKQVGDSVAVDEPLLEVSTDKVDTEIPSPVAGTLLEISVAEDETVDVGAQLAVIGAEGASAPAAPAPAAPEPTPAAPEPAAQEAPSAPAAAPAAPPAPTPAPTPTPAPAPQKQAETGGDASPYVTPLVRKLAAEHNVDLGTLTGTGVGGRIRKQDVLAAAEAAKAPAAAPQAAPSAAPTAEPSAEAVALRGKTEKMSRLRQVIAQRMVESMQVSAQLTTVVEVDVTKIARLRDRAKKAFQEREGVKLSFLPFFAKATVEALKQHPKLNASLNEQAKEITYHGAEHLVVAVDTDRGLLVPVIHNAGDLNLGGLARKIADLAERTRANKITPDELSGGTFSLTNTGSRGALFDTPIVFQPQVGILGVGSVVKRPVVVSDEAGGDTIAIRSMVYLALSYDHRLVDGADAARFLSTMKQRLEEGAFEADLGL